MKITTLTDAPAVPFKIDGKIMFSGSRSEVIQLTLAPADSCLEIRSGLLIRLISNKQPYIDSLRFFI